MQAMKDFITWFFTQLPTFLLAEPICYLLGFFFLFVVIGLVRQIINLT